MRVFNHKLGIMVEVKEEPKEIKVKNDSSKKKPAKQNDSDSNGVAEPVVAE